MDDKLYAEVRTHFSETELVDLTMAIMIINGWNRIAKSFKMEPVHTNAHSCWLLAASYARGQQPTAHFTC